MNEGHMVYYQHQDKQAWLDPVKLFAVKGSNIFIFSNGNVRNLPRCNVQLCETEDDDSEEKDEEQVNSEKQEKESKENKKKENSVSFEDQTDELKRVEENRRITRSMTDIERRDLDREQISTFWLKVENTLCFDNIYTVEVLVKEHKMTEVIEAKEKETSGRGRLLGPALELEKTLHIEIKLKNKINPLYPKGFFFFQT